MKKNCFKKDQIFKKWDNCENRPSSNGYSLCKKVWVKKLKIKIPKNMQKSILQPHESSSVQKKDQTFQKWGVTLRLLQALAV